jgi:hypothetical protein
VKEFRFLARGSRRLTRGRARGPAYDCPHDTDKDNCEREKGDSNTSCGQYSDAMVCVNGNEDLACSTFDFNSYRGCHYGASSDHDPGSDYCCAGWIPGSNDNIDHGSCASGDADWGSTCIGWDDQQPPECETKDIPP